MRPKLLLSALSFLLIHFCYGQREYALCDSTFYTYNADTTIVAGRKHLYYHTAAGLTLCRDFTTTDTAEYIRDFDIINPNLWYTLVGLKYIGGPTSLYKSTDRGATWTIDTTFYPATRYHPTNANSYYNSVNQLQHIGSDTIVLFVGYYESGLVYSTDGGTTWTEWFRNQITHYQGLLECGDNYYLYGFYGDAFRSWMFPFPKNMLFSANTAGAWISFANINHPNCSGSVHPDCVYVPNPYHDTRCGQYTYLKHYADSICPTVGIADGPVSAGGQSPVLFPNPTDGSFFITPAIAADARIRMFDFTGREIQVTITHTNDGKSAVSIEKVPKGLYTITISSPNGTTARKILIN